MLVFPKIACRCSLEISAAHRFSTTLLRSGTGRSLSNLSRPPSSVVPITSLSLMRDSFKSPNSQDSASLHRRRANSSIDSSDF